MHIVRAAPGIVPLLLAIASCNSPAPTAAEPGPSLTGSYVLVSYDSLQIPADLGPMPGKNGEVLECHTIVTGGDLILEEEAGTFHYHYESRSSCGQALLSNPNLAGSVTREGTILVFTIQGIDGPSQFLGTVENGRIVIRELEFQRVPEE